MTRRLTPQHETFCVEYAFDGSGGRAARAAGISNPGTARKQACAWLKWPEIQARIAELKAERIERLKIDQDELVRQWVEMANVDINEIVEYRRVNCRYCWGVDHEYQWTPAEFRAAERKYARLSDAVKQRELPPDEIGGTDYDVTRTPCPECPECRGEGIGRMIFKDSRTLSPAARRLYEGMQIGKDGQKALHVDRAKLHEMIGRALGAFKDKIELTGKNGGPVATVTSEMSVKEAADLYAASLNPQK